MLKKSLILAALLSALGCAGSLPAQQAESVTPGQPLPPEVKQFQGYEDQWSEAVVHSDQYTLEDLLSPLYVGISSTGDVSTRNQQIAGLFEKGAGLVSMEQRVVTVRLFGETAVVSGTYDLRWKIDGRPREERGIFTHVYARRQDRWECVNAQRTAVVDLTPGSGKAKSSGQQKSSADEPFHIPFFYKGKPSSQPTSAQNTNIPPN